MIKYNYVICLFLLFTLSLATSYAQPFSAGTELSKFGYNNTNSPYTKYGLGQLSAQRPGNSTAMGGVAYALRNGMNVNFANPASYSAVDSLTFIFDGGFTLQNTNLSEGTTKLNAQNTSLDYIAIQLRLHKKLGLSLGVLPYSNVGYYFSTKLDDSDPDENAHNYTSYMGDGGLHQTYIGLGYQVVKGLSVGANLSFMFGNITRIASVTYPYNTSVSGYTELEKLEVKDYKLDFGIQYTVNLNPKNALTVGAVYSPKQNLNNNAWIQKNNTARDTVADFGIPNQFGAGIAYQYDRRLIVSADYTLEQWGSVAYMNDKSYYSDRSTYAIGAEFLPNLYTRKYLARVKYRIGAYYSEPYYKINDMRATKEYGVSVGFGLPVLQSASIINISGQYVRVERQASNLINENYLKLSVGLTFNENWFMKRKVR